MAKIWHLLDIIIREIITSLVLQEQDFSQGLERLISGVPSFEQRNFILASLKLVSSDFLSSITTSEDGADWWRADAATISAAAGLIKLILADEDSRKTQVLAWLTSSSGAGVGEGIAVRRAVMAVLAADKSLMETIFDKSLLQFGDQLYIKHTPTMQQDGKTVLPRLKASTIAKAASSSCPSSALICRLCAQKSPATPSDGHEIWVAFKCGIKQTCCIFSSSTVPRYDCRRSFIWSCRQAG